MTHDRAILVVEMIRTTFGRRLNSAQKSALIDGLRPLDVSIDQVTAVVQEAYRAGKCKSNFKWIFERLEECSRNDERERARIEAVSQGNAGDGDEEQRDLTPFIHAWDWASGLSAGEFEELRAEAERRVSPIVRGLVHRYRRGTQRETLGGFVTMLMYDIAHGTDEVKRAKNVGRVYAHDEHDTHDQETTT